MPALPRFFHPARYCTRPRNIPTAAITETPVPRVLGGDAERAEDAAELLALGEPPADQRGDEGARC